MRKGIKPLNMFVWLLIIVFSVVLWAFLIKAGLAIHTFVATCIAIFIITKIEGRKS